MLCVVLCVLLTARFALQVVLAFRDRFKEGVLNPNFKDTPPYDMSNIS